MFCFVLFQTVIIVFFKKTKNFHFIWNQAIHSNKLLHKVNRIKFAPSFSDCICSANFENEAKTFMNNVVTIFSKWLKPETPYL